MFMYISEYTIAALLPKKEAAAPTPTDVDQASQVPCSSKDCERCAHGRIRGDEIHCVGGPAWEVARASSRGVLEHGALM